MFDKLIFDIVKDYERVITWADAAPKTAEACIATGIPYINMIRWWKNVQPVPPGRLYEREVDHEFIESRRFIFENAHENITNNHWAAGVVEHFYGIRPKVSYVPVNTETRTFNTSRDGVVVVTPEKQLGEWEVIDEVSEQHQVYCVNSNHDHSKAECTGYVEDMDEIWGKVHTMLYPIYYNDVCGCSRIAFEAMSRGVVPICTDACGFDEWLPKEWLIDRNAPMEEWNKKIAEIDEDDQQHAFILFNRYVDKQPEQLEVFNNAVNKV
jgi:hypothetical protein